MFTNISLPDTSSSSSYTKLPKEGEPPLNFRIVSDQIINGWQYFQHTSEDGGIAPVRSQQQPKTLEDPTEGFEGKPQKPAFFASFFVYNYNTENVEVMTITQKTILNFLQELENNPRFKKNIWDVDFTISRTDKTTYSISYFESEMADEKYLTLVNSVKDKKLEKLFDNENPLEN